MIEDNKIVKSIEAKAGGKGGTYWTITWQDGKFDNIFNHEWLPLLEQSRTELRLLHFTKEKQDGSKYFNIKTLELSPLPTIKEKAPPEPTLKEKLLLPPRTEYPDGVNDGRTPLMLEHASDAPQGNSSPPLTTNDRIDRAVWWKELGECLRSGYIDKTSPHGVVLSTTYSTEMCRVLGIKFQEVQPVKNNLVETAKKMGAKEV